MFTSKIEISSYKVHIGDGERMDKYPGEGWVCIKIIFILKEKNTVRINPRSNFSNHLTKSPDN